MGLFSNLSIVKNITLPSTITQIESNAFENCSNLEKITIPENVIEIGEKAFSGCSSLSNVVVLKDSYDITNIEKNVFLSCNPNLQIQVPKNRYVDYCNALNWCDYDTKIITDGIIEEIDLSCISSGEKTISFDAGSNKLYKLNIDCTKSYKFSSDSDIVFEIYNLSKGRLYCGNKILKCYLSSGEYYLDIRTSSYDESGMFSIKYELTYPIKGIKIYNDTINDITSSIHLNSNNLKHAVFVFENMENAGIYKFKLVAGNESLYPESSIKICFDAERNDVLYRYGMSDVSMYAETAINENELYVFLPYIDYYYIEVNLYNISYSNVSLEISRIEENCIDYLSYFNGISFDVLFEKKNTTNYF